MELVDALSKEELRNYKLFLRQYKTSNKDLLVEKLFDAYKNNSGLSDHKIQELLFPELKKNAFYQIKSRMIEGIYKSLLVLNYKKDEGILIKNYLALSEIFSYKSEFKISYGILKKALKIAEKSGLYQLQKLVYNKLIDLSLMYDDIQIGKYLIMKKEVNKKIQEIDGIKDFINEYTWHLKKSNYDIENQSILDVLNKIENDLLYGHHIKDDINTQIQLQKIVRNILLQKKNYKSLDLYIQNQLENFEKGNFYNKSNLNHKIVMQVWLINSNLKLKNFNKSLSVSEDLKKSLLSYNKLHFNNFIWTYYQSKFIASFFLGKLNDAIDILYTLKSEKVIKGHGYYDMFLNFNLFMVYFSKNNYKKANQYLNELLKPALYKTLSPELKMSVNVVDLIMYYENDDFNYLIYRIKEIKRKFRTSLSKPNFERVKSFLKLLDVLSKYPTPFENKKVLPKIEQFIANSPPFEPGNNENINYKVWLLSKLNKRSYFEELLLEVKND